MPDASVHRLPEESVDTAMTWRAGRFTFHFPGPALIMGIVNVTPDSFSDGGRFQDPDAAAARAVELVQQGAAIIDVGGESTRPGAESVSEAEELKRVIPVLERLAPQLKIPISVDTQKASVARAALQAGASIVNDVSANRSEPEMWRVVAEAGAGYVCMHMQGTPKTMQANPTYRDVVADVEAFWRDRLEKLERAGVSPQQVVLDPGFGFGKTLEHNLQLLAGWPRLTKMKRPLVLGVSRKSFMGRLPGCGANDRVPASLACSCWASGSGVQIVRTHDIPETLAAVRMIEAILAKTE